MVDINISECKRCGSTSLQKNTFEVYTIDWEDTLEVNGIECNDCNCLHYYIDDFFIYEFPGMDHINKDKETLGKYVTDYDRALMRNEYEVIQ